ncbi:MAG: hypothetical protein ACOX6T_17105 [Myxococcales bacterium]|jgi:hypothetical protein
MSRLLAHVLLLLLPVQALAAPPRDTLLLAWSTSGEHALVRESIYRPDGSALISFRVVGPGVLQQRHEVSNDQTPGEGPRLQRISAADCRKALLELKKTLVATRFRGVDLRGDNCASLRSEVVEVSAELALAAEHSELVPEGDALVREELRVQVEREGLVLQTPKAKKRLRLPRPIAPEAATVLLSPSRRLLLVLVGAPTGEQVLTAGFSSKTGEISDFQ